MNLELKGFFRFFPLIILPAMLMFGLFGTIQAFDGSDPLPKVFMLVWMGGVLYQIIKFVKMVVNIRLINNIKLIFKTILGKEHELFVDDLVLIKVSNNIIEFKTNIGKFILMGNYDGFSEFVVAVKKLNPGLITKGC